MAANDNKWVIQSSAFPFSLNTRHMCNTHTSCPVMEEVSEKDTFLPPLDTKELSKTIKTQCHQWAVIEKGIPFTAWEWTWFTILHCAFAMTCLSLTGCLTIWLLNCSKKLQNMKYRYFWGIILAYPNDEFLFPPNIFLSCLSFHQVFSREKRYFSVIWHTKSPVQLHRINRNFPRITLFHSLYLCLM